jgi:NDP-sugar pyrophosphorylase family protein
MKCIILAAGYGSRMKELTKRTPKPMLLIKNKPKLA